MPDERCRVTVVGERRRVDLALPAQAPIAEFVPRLAVLCGKQESEAMPPVWSLAQAGADPLTPADSLASAGVLDGAVLYLCDHREGELTDLTVTDLDEQVADAREDSGLWNARHRAQTVLGAGLLVTVAPAAWLAAHRTAGIAVGFFALAGLCSALLAWFAARKNWPVPTAMRQVLALAACPLLACAGLGAPLHGPVTTPVLVCVTAALGALAGLVALPSVSTVVLQLITVAVAVVAVPLTVLGSSVTGAAAVVATVLYLLAGLLPRLTSQIAVLVPGGQDTGSAALDGAEVAAVVRRGNRLLTFFALVVSALLAGSLLTLSASRGACGLALAGCVSVGLLFQAGSVRLLTAVVPQLAAGVVGLLALAVRLPSYIADSHLAGPLAAFGAGVVLVATGLVLAFGAALRPLERERPSWPSALAGFLAVATVPLAAGVFGLFGWLANLGGGL